MGLRYNPPPGWDVKVGEDGSPVGEVNPDPAWPEPPEDWQFWVIDEAPGESQASSASPEHDRLPPQSQQGVSSESPSSEVNEDEQAQQTDISTDGSTAQGSQKPPLRLTQDEVLVLDDQLLLQSHGIYDYHHPLEDSPAYEEALQALRQDIVNLLEKNEAIIASSAFAFEGSFAAGQKMIKELSQLCLRAFNSEVDISMRTMRAGSLELAKKRLEKSRDSIEKLGSRLGLRIADTYFDYRVREVELVSDLLHKKQEEKERAREERARLREEARVQKELEDRGKGLRKELARLESIIDKLRAENRMDDLPELQEQAAELEGAIEENDFRAANIRSGYVYVVSNVGSLGDTVVKIGLTRRLEPEERIKELSDASVPFVFDKHIIYFSEDAVGLEAELHDEFAARRVNLVNTRKEFFFATPAEVQEALEKRVGTLLEFTREPSAEEYFQSKPNWV